MKKKRDIRETHYVGRMSRSEMTHVKARRLLVDGVPKADLRVFMVNAEGRHVPTARGFWFPPEALLALRRLVDRPIHISPEARQKALAAKRDDDKPK
jgi:hypothetical protein